jgi:hypothetical protein
MANRRSIKRDFYEQQWSRGSAQASDAFVRTDAVELILAAFCIMALVQRSKKTYVLSHVLKIAMHKLIQTQFSIQSPLGNLTWHTCKIAVCG